jgi:hypothetical protein
VDIGPFDVVAAHRALEICETRIQRGEDPAHRHPALACQANTDNLDLSERERGMWDRYAVVRIEEATPAFWPARIWDEAETQMNEAQTERIAARIEATVGEIGPKVKKSVSIPVPKKMGRPKRVFRGNDPTVVAIDFRSYQTDEDETDWLDL